MNRKKFKLKQLSIENSTLRQDLASLRHNHDIIQAAHAPHFKVCEGYEHCVGHAVAYDRNIAKLADQASHSNFLEMELKTLKDKYKAQITSVKLTAQLLENELAKVRSELDHIIAKAESADKLRAEVKKLRAKVNRRDSVIDRYESKYGHMLKLIKTMNRKGLFKNPKTTVQTDNEDVFVSGPHQKSEKHNMRARKSVTTTLATSDVASSLDTPLLSCLAIALKHKLKVNSSNVRVV